MKGPEPIPDARILVIDDQLANVALLEDLLEQAGYTAVKGITDARVAAPTFHEFRPDLVLLDVMLPGIDGFETCRRLKLEYGEKSAHIPLESGNVYPG